LPEIGDLEDELQITNTNSVVIRNKSYNMKDIVKIADHIGRIDEMVIRMPIRCRSKIRSEKNIDERPEVIVMGQGARSIIPITGEA